MTTPDAPSSKRIGALDALRALFAGMVVFHHIRPITLADHYLLDFVLQKIYNTISFGPGAVIGFFVISGFCIQATSMGKAFNAREFYARRFTRTGIPLTVTAIWAAWAGVNYNPLVGAVTWSLVCEEIYYLVYPLFHQIVIPRFGFARLTIFCGLVGVGCSLSSPPEKTTAALLCIALAYFPIWLLGAWLAETTIGRVEDPKRSTLRPTASPFAWRIGIFAVFGFTAEITARRTFLPAPFLMLLTGGLLFLWLRMELSHNTLIFPRFLETAGKWSYSVYLTHILFQDAWSNFISSSHWLRLYPLRYIRRALDLKTLHGWGLELIAVFIGAYVFYWLVEKPSHRWARSIVVPTASLSSQSGNSFPPPANG